FEPHATVAHDAPGALVHLVVPECLAGLEPDEHRAGLVLRVNDDGRAAAARRLDVVQVPALQEPEYDARRSGRSRDHYTHASCRSSSTATRWVRSARTATSSAQNAARPKPSSSIRAATAPICGSTSRAPALAAER